MDKMTNYLFSLGFLNAPVIRGFFPVTYLGTSKIANGGQLFVPGSSGTFLHTMSWVLSEAVVGVGCETANHDQRTTQIVSCQAHIDVNNCIFINHHIHSPILDSLPTMLEYNEIRRELKRSRATIDNSDLGSSCLALRRAPKPKKRQSLPPKKNVHFSSTSNLVFFENSPSSVTWYTNKDHQRFKREQKRDIMIFREQQLLRSTASVVYPTDSCSVGIEQHIVTTALAESYLCRRIVIQSVILEQTRQRILGYCDPCRIASLAERLTADSCSNALLRGQYQEEVAKLAVLDVRDV